MYRLDVEVSFENEKTAGIVVVAIGVDGELKKGVSRMISQKCNIISASFSSNNLKDLRGSAKGFLEGMHLIFNTISSHSIDLL